MTKGDKQKSGKGILIVAVLTILALAAGVTSIILLSRDRTLSQLFGGDSNVYESARLSNLSMNGEYIGDEVSEEAKSQVALDEDFQYMYHGVCYWVDENDKITELAFYSIEDMDGTVFMGIEDSNIQYKGQKLETIDDFEEAFGLADIEKKDESVEIYRYFQGDYKLEIEIIDRVVQNVILKKDA